MELVPLENRVTVIQCTTFACFGPKDHLLFSLGANTSASTFLAFKSVDIA